MLFGTWLEAFGSTGHPGGVCFLLAGPGRSTLSLLLHFGKEGTMPTWLVPTLKWGGIGLAIIAAVAILYVRFIAAAPAPEAGAPSGGAPVALYWILFGIGVVAAIAGFVLEGRKRST
jgi:hypothetical protein